MQKSYVSKPGCIEEVSEEKVDTNIYDVVGFDHTKMYSVNDLATDKDENNNYKYYYFNVWIYCYNTYQFIKRRVTEIFNNFNKKNSLIIPFQMYDFKQINYTINIMEFPDTWKRLIGSSDKKVVYKYFYDNFPPRITFIKYNGNNNKQDLCKISYLYQNYYTNKIIKSENINFGYHNYIVVGNSFHVGSRVTRDEWLKSAQSEIGLTYKNKDLKLQNKLIFMYDCKYIYQQ